MLNLFKQEWFSLLLEWSSTFTQISSWLDCANRAKLDTRYRLEASTITWLEPIFSVNRSSGLDWRWLRAAPQRLCSLSLAPLSWVLERTTITATIWKNLKTIHVTEKFLFPFCSRLHDLIKHFLSKKSLYENNKLTKNVHDWLKIIKRVKIKDNHSLALFK